MQPDDPNNRRPISPLVPERQASYTPAIPDREHPQQAAAANIVRSQIDTLYASGSEPTSQPTPEDQAQNPYQRTHTEQHHVAQTDQWKQYHSAWQDYYQKYYERYYMGEVHKTKQELASQPAQLLDGRHLEASEPVQDKPLTKQEALYDLRRTLFGHVKRSARKVRGSRHFIPIAAAACVMLVFLFLQYNRVLFASVEAYVSPGNIDPVNIIVDPTLSTTVSPEPKLIIPKINVNVPVVYNTTPDYAAQMKAMESGVAWFGIPGANSKPGQIGNTVLSGHSSNDLLDSGSYKFIFARLEQVNAGDTIYANYEGKRYTYTITKKEVVKPTEVSKLIYPTDKPILTLITCTPLGTALNRLLVTAEQVSPSPSEAPKAPETSATQTAEMPGNSPTFFQRLFGAGS
jgi:sortase A